LIFCPSSLRRFYEQDLLPRQLFSRQHREKGALRLCSAVKKSSKEHQKFFAKISKALGKNFKKTSQAKAANSVRGQACL